jgi:hypothetical protein
MKYFPIFASLGLVALFSGCTVESKGDKCTPGEQQPCHCGNDTGTQSCSADGQGWGSCDCGGAAGGAGSGAGGASQAGATSSGGATGSGGNYAGGSAGVSGSTGGTAPDGGGPDASAGGAGGAATGGAGGNQGPDGGIDFTAECLACAQTVCPTELQNCFDNPACFNDADGGTPGEFTCMLDCMSIDRGSNTTKPGFVSPTDVAACGGPDVCGTAGWPGGVSSETSALVNCLANSSTFQDGPWATPAPTNCTNECFGAHKP